MKVSTGTRPTSRVNNSEFASKVSRTPALARVEPLLAGLGHLILEDPDDILFAAAKQRLERAKFGSLVAKINALSEAATLLEGVSGNLYVKTSDFTDVAKAFAEIGERGSALHMLSKARQSANADLKSLLCSPSLISDQLVEICLLMNSYGAETADIHPVMQDALVAARNERSDPSSRADNLCNIALAMQKIGAAAWLRVAKILVLEARANAMEVKTEKEGDSRCVSLARVSSAMAKLGFDRDSIGTLLLLESEAIVEREKVNPHFSSPISAAAERCSVAKRLIELNFSLDAQPILEDAHRLLMSIQEHIYEVDRICALSNVACLMKDAKCPATQIARVVKDVNTLAKNLPTVKAVEEANALLQ